MGNMAVKVDSSKAYDIVEWSFLLTIIEKLGFGQQWISLVMQFVSSISYSSLVNEKPGEVLYPTRGLRQADPLSPYIFH